MTTEQIALEVAKRFCSDFAEQRRQAGEEAPRLSLAFLTELDAKVGDASYAAFVLKIYCRLCV